MEPKKMDPIIDIIWSVEEESEIASGGAEITANCGGGGGISCCIACCSVPNMITKWICT